MWSDLRAALPLGIGVGPPLVQLGVWVSFASRGSNDSIGWLASRCLHAARIAGVALGVRLHSDWILLRLAWPRQGDDIGIASFRPRDDRNDVSMDAVHGGVHPGIGWIRVACVIAKAGGCIAAGSIDGDHCDFFVVANHRGTVRCGCGRLAPHECKRRACPVAGIPFVQRGYVD